MILLGIHMFIYISTNIVGENKVILQAKSKHGTLLIKQTTEALDLQPIVFMQIGRIHRNFTHNTVRPLI